MLKQIYMKKFCVFLNCVSKNYNKMLSSGHCLLMKIVVYFFRETYFLTNEFLFTSAFMMPFFTIDRQMARSEVAATRFYGLMPPALLSFLLVEQSRLPQGFLTHW